MNFKLLFNDKKFIKNTFKIIGPATLQAFISSLSGLINVFIIGNFVNVGQNGVAGVSIATSIFGLSMLLSYSATIAGNIFAGQYYGDDNLLNVRITTNFKILLSFMCSLVLILICFAIKMDNILKLFLPNSNDPNITQILDNGVVYLKISIWSCLISSLSIPLIFTANTFNKKNYTLILVATGSLIVESVLTVLTLTVIPIDTNINGDHIVIAGPAISFIVAKFIELIGVIIYYLVKKPFYAPTRNFWYIPKKIWGKGLKVWILLLPSEFLFQIYYILFSIILGRLTDNPEQVLGPVNISNSMIDISWCVINGSILGIPQLIGKKLGNNELDEAKENAKKLRALTFLISIVLSLFIFCSAFIISNFLFQEFDDESKKVLLISMIGCALVYFLYSNAYLNFNIIRSGGIQWIPSLFDIPIQYVVQLPLLIILLLFSNISPGWIIFICDLTYIIPFTLSNVFFYKLNWNKKIIYSETEKLQ